MKKYRKSSVAKLGVGVGRVRAAGKASNPTTRQAAGRGANPTAKRASGHIVNPKLTGNPATKVDSSGSTKKTHLTKVGLSHPRDLVPRQVLEVTVGRNKIVKVKDKNGNYIGDLFDNNGNLIWTPRNGKRVTILPEDDVAVVWEILEADETHPQEIVEVGHPRLFMQAKFRQLKIKVDSRSMKSTISLEQKLKVGGATVEYKENGIASVKSKLDVPLYGPLYVGVIGAINSQGRVNGTSQLGLKGGKDGLVEVKAGVEIDFDIDVVAARIVFEGELVDLRETIRKLGYRELALAWQPILDALSPAER